MYCKNCGKEISENSVRCDKQFSNKMKNVKFSLFLNLFRGLYYIGH